MSERAPKYIERSELKRTDEMEAEVTGLMHEYKKNPDARSRGYRMDFGANDEDLQKCLNALGAKEIDDFMPDTEYPDSKPIVAFAIAGSSNHIYGIESLYKLKGIDLSRSIVLMGLATDLNGAPHDVAVAFGGITKDGVGILAQYSQVFNTVGLCHERWGTEFFDDAFTERSGRFKFNTSDRLGYLAMVGNDEGIDIVPRQSYSLSVFDAQAIEGVGSQWGNIRPSIRLRSDYELVNLPDNIKQPQKPATVYTVPGNIQLGQE